MRKLPSLGCAPVLPHEQRPEHLLDVLRQHLRATRIEPPTAERLDRVVRSAIAQFEEQVTLQVMARLSAPTLQNLEALLNVGTGESKAEEKAAGQEEVGVATSTLAHLKADPGRASLESVLTEITRLEQLRRLNLPPDLFRDVSPKLVHAWRRSIASRRVLNLRTWLASRSGFQKTNASGGTCRRSSKEQPSLMR